MKSAFATIASLSLAALFSVSAIAAPTAKAKTAKTAATKAPLICPVTGEKIASVKDSVGSSVYKGKTYYFCCAECKPMFDKNPAKYVKSASAAPATKVKPAAKG